MRTLNIIRKTTTDEEEKRVLDTIIPQLSFDGIIYPTRIIKAYGWNKDKWWKAFGNLTTRYKEFIEVTVHWGSDGKKTVDSVYGEDALTITEIN